MQIRDIDGQRTIEFDGNNAGSPDSVFIAGPHWCVEIGREEFLRVMREEFGMVEPLEVGLERFLRQAA